MTRQATRTPGNCNHQTSPEWLLICCNMTTAPCRAALKSDQASRRRKLSGASQSMKQPRCAYWSAFLVFLLGAFACADSIQAALPSENKPPTRELTQSSEQNKSS